MNRAKCVYYYRVERRDTSSGGGAFYRVEGRFYGLERRGNMRILYMYMYTLVTTCLNETKKGGETSKSKILKSGWPTCI